MKNVPFEIPDSPIFGKAVAVAGTLARFPREQEVFCRLLERYGGRLSPSVTDDTAYLVYNGLSAPTPEMDEARKMNIPILSETEFLALLQQGCTKGKAADFIIENDLLVKYIGSDPDVIIPEVVRSIGPGAFKECCRMRSVTVPDGIRDIGDEAFAGCNHLQGISLPASVRHIGKQAFFRCDNLLYAELPEGLETIGAKAFYQAEHLQSLVIPSTVTHIGQEAFSSCRNLLSLTLRDGVKHIGYFAFSFCTRLSSLAVPASAVPEAGAFSYCEGLRSLVLPAGPTEVASSMFAGCSSLTSVVIPAGVKTIGLYAFADCSSLRSVSLPEGLTHIGESAFTRCGFETIPIPKSVTSIGARAFRYCALRHISIPEGVTSIGDEAFFFCHRLETVTVPQSLVTLGAKAFYHCQSLREITIPEGVQDVPEDIFFGCRAMADAKGFLIVGSRLISAFLEGCTQLVIPEGITHIRDYALFDTDELETVTVPSSVTALGDHFLERLPELKSVILPPGVTSLKAHSLVGCTELQLLRAPGLPGDILEKRNLLTPAAVGYLCCPEAYTVPEIAAFYREYVTRHRRQLITVLLEEDRVDAIAAYAAMGQITGRNFDTDYLQPALAAKAIECITFLMDWKNKNLPTEYEVALDDDPFNERDMTRLWKPVEVPGGFVIMGYLGQEDTLVIPPRIGEKPVLEIGPFALSPENGSFQQSRRQVLCRLAEVSLSHGIAAIRAKAFSGCLELTKISLPATVTAIGDQAFADCPLLTIHAPAGSYAEEYATEQNIPFVAE